MAPEAPQPLFRRQKILERQNQDMYMHRAWLMDAPSQTSMRREQLDGAGGPLILNWRPTQEASVGLPPELADPTFAEVVGLLDSDDTAPLDQTVIDVACQLCCVGADIYVDEVTRPRTPPTNLFLIAEIKPSMGGGTGDSHFQGANYHLHFWRQRGNSEIFKSTCCPAFLLEVVGPHARLSAVAWLDRVTIFPLTPLLNLLPAHPVTDRLLMPVARMLAALRAGLRMLARRAHAVDAAERTAAAERGAVAPAAGAATVKAVQARAANAKAAKPNAEATKAAETAEVDAEELAEMLSKAAAAGKQRPLPWPIAMDARYNAATARQLVNPNHTCRVDLAGTGGGGGGGTGGELARSGAVVVVKLCQSYGLAAHQRWAELGLAPQVLRSEPLPGGWLLVEMEWLPTLEWRKLSELLLLLSSSGPELAQALSAAQGALARAHAATGLVHGDMRPPNCLVRRSGEAGAPAWEVRFVDFEWAGPEGEATYPACMNPAIPWPEGVGYRKPLHREHDTQLLAATVAGGGRTGVSAAISGTAGGGRRARRSPGAAAVRATGHTAASGRQAVPPPGTAAVAAVRRRSVGVGGERLRAATAGWTRAAAAAAAATGRARVW
ncbi:hypothetical protein HYH02_007905 [Chlamydomonas schloesseri]|uniref:Protein kinase domain-containing protein n=1 Tax=Chlamydomonas schloesseri TaxID=2026947 RepID=A0A836B4M5_9CHLO|nr:hypothetical protein HYH02_007905 [Chlamydomonas schloesseri]|eukprot:KAG2447159.1 hypothetical protein HYH02_007905 [Chlamydomonas schloesseri]